MKKSLGFLLLIAISCSSISFVCGFFLGRNQNTSPIQISGMPQTMPTETTSQSHPAEEQSTVAVESGLVNINTATLEQLQTLPGIGPVLAQRILDYRELNGPFSTIADLTNVSGIGAKRLETILELITTGG